MNGREMLLLYVTLAFIPNILGVPKKIPIGGLFDSDEMIQKAFEISITKHSKGILLTPRTKKINKNAFQVANIAYKLINNGVAGIFGPQDKSTANHIQSMCDTLDIPHIAARWDSEPKRGNVINLYPHSDTLSMVFQDLIKEFKWKEYAVLYDNADALIRMNRLLKLPNLRNISAMVFHLGSGPNFSPVVNARKYRDDLRYDCLDMKQTSLAQPHMSLLPTFFSEDTSHPKINETRFTCRQTMKEVKISGYKNIIIDCSYDILESVLKQAQQVGIMTEKHRIIIASLDLQTLDLEPYQYSGVNITGVRLIDPKIDRHTLQSLNLTDGSHLRVEAALAYDAVQLFASSYARLLCEENFEKLSCNRTKIWGHSFSLSNYIRNEQIHGLSGMIKFDTAGLRSEFQLDIINLGNEGLHKVGIWTNFGIQWEPRYRIPGLDDDKNLRDKHFRVLISLTNPYGMFKESSSIMIGNDRYEGFAIDIIQEMSKMLGFNYTFEVQTDGTYGSFNNDTKKWNGMLGKIIAGEADLAITDLTITAEREKAVDFTNPFMNLGISVLYRTPTRAPPGLLSFLGPFSKDVWIHVIGAYIAVSTLLFVIGKLCPAEWKNPYPCIKEPEVLETPFTLTDTPFLVIGAILKSPTGFAPVGISTRALGVAWWFFTLIIVTMYIANLAAALSTKSVVWSFQTAEELAYQQKIKYGAKTNGSTFFFFKDSAYWLRQYFTLLLMEVPSGLGAVGLVLQDSTHEAYKIMYNYMYAHRNEVLMDSNEKGVWKVQHDDYAYLMESSSIEYIKQRKCNVTQIGGLLDAKGYGIAMRKGASYRPDLNGIILKLQENGVIGELQTKWWKQKRGGDVCEEKDKVEVAPLNFEDVGGVFLIMISGVALSWIFAGWTFLWNIRNIAIRHNVSFKEEVIEELKFLIKCSNKKIVRRRKSSFETIESNSTGS